MLSTNRLLPVGGRKPPSPHPQMSPDLSFCTENHVSWKVMQLKIYALFYKIAQRETLFPLSCFSSSPGLLSIFLPKLDHRNGKISCTMHPGAGCVPRWQEMWTSEGNLLWPATTTHPERCTCTTVLCKFFLTSVLNWDLFVFLGRWIWLLLGPVKWSVTVYVDNLWPSVIKPACQV